jgi:hypothetical protein
MSRLPPVLTTAALDVKLRVNDIERHIINVDSRFRDSPAVSTSSNFYFTLLTPVRNVLRVRITSIEFPNNYHVFTAKRGNTSLEVFYIESSGSCGAMRYPITIPEGNYTAIDMVDALTAALASTPVSWLTVDFDEVTGTFTFTGNQYFAINTTYGGYDRPYDYGLGYYLGLTRKCHKAPGVGPTWSVTSDQCAYFAGDPYVFLCLNDFQCVRQTVQIYDVAGRNRLDAADFNALAKVVLREPKNYMAFDDYASQHVKEVVFPSPTDLNRLKVQVLDPYGEIMDLCSSQISFSIEVLEVKNASLYNTIRDSLALHYV